ncbi:MAG: hypothetical protein HY898_25130 [Deltaproteobacteria bacterium]|nr:hypothetical protein [Deltaproteobacteria bacterium]
MSGGIPFHSTRMGQRFYESTLPELVRELKRLNQNLERLLEVANTDDQPAPEAGEKGGPRP